jgi:prepilin-type processing-associated H-X9-DG protein
LLELIAVVAISTILAALLFPAVARARQSGLTAVCVGNQNQLGLAWRLYTEDNNGWFPWAQEFPRARPGWPIESNQPVWCRGRMDYTGSGTDRTNVNLLVGSHPGSLGLYLRRPAIYRCPLDRSPAQTVGGREAALRVRSYSMNLNFGFPEDLVHELSVFNHERDLRRHASGPSGLSVFWDESEASIASTAFDDPTLHPGEWILASIPATRHRSGSTVSFADGHAEVHRWKDPAILLYSPLRSIRGISTAVDSHDFWWICNAMRTRGYASQ